jgi:autotransporter adhesin
MPISEKEFELKDKLIRQTILNNGTQLKSQQEQLNKIENKIDKIDERLYNINTK